MSYQFEFTCSLPHGLHARPASWLEKEVNKFETEIILTNKTNGKQANAKSVLSLIAADVRFNDDCLITVENSDPDSSGKIEKIFSEQLGKVDTPIETPERNEGAVSLNPSLRNIGIDHISGIAAVGGYGVGKAVFIDELEFPVIAAENDPANGDDKLRKLDHAFSELRNKFSRDKSENSQVSGIMAAHLSILNDVEYYNQIRSRIVDDCCSISTAIKQSSDYFTDRLNNTGNVTLIERGIDIKDVSLQLIQSIYGDSCAVRSLVLTEPSICIADNLTPTELLKLDRNNLKGLVLTEAAGTSHTIIIARSYGIPTVTSAKIPMSLSETRVVVDGMLGIVVKHPSDEVLDYYDRQIESLQKTPGCDPA